jgi:ABC-type transporter Mla subunit MlaD
VIPLRVRHADKVVAAFLASTLFVVVAMLFFVIKGQQIFVERIPFYTLFDDAGGVAPETPVKIAGIEVGKVRRLTLTDANRVRVDFDVLQTFADRVRADPPGDQCQKILDEIRERCSLTVLSDPSVAAVPDVDKSCQELEADRKYCGSRVRASLPAGLGAFLPGGGGLVLTVGYPQAAKLAPGGYVPSEVEKGLNDVVSELSKQGVVQNTQEIVAQLAVLLQRVNDAQGPVWETLENLRGVSRAVRQGKGPVGQALQDGSVLDQRLQAALANLDKSLASFQAAAASLGKMTEDADRQLPALYEALANLQRVSDDAKAATKDLRVFAEDVKAVPPSMVEAFDNIDRKVDDLGTILDGLRTSFPLNLVVAPPNTAPTALDAPLPSSAVDQTPEPQMPEPQTP